MSRILRARRISYQDKVILGVGFLEEPDFRSMEITVVGLGLIGGSFAMALKKLQPKRIWAVDTDRETLAKAEKDGVITKGFTDTKVPLQSSDLVIICIYPELAVTFIKDNMAYFKQAAIITDTAGIKEKLVREIGTCLRSDVSFVGGHPLAGKELGGYAHAGAEIFQQANYLLTPVPGTPPESIALIKKMLLELGFRPPLEMTPAKHDAIIALTSQLPHVIAAALMNSAEAEDTGNLVGGSFRDATRVARMNPELWSELLLENKEHILDEIDRFIDNVRHIRAAIADNNHRLLYEILKNSGEERGKF